MRVRGPVQPPGGAGGSARRRWRASASRRPAPLSAAVLGVQVVPNPSVGATVAGEGAARAWVVDAVGRRVAELWAGELPGAQTVALDVSGWAAGVYAVVVEAEGARRATAFTVAR